MSSTMKDASLRQLRGILWDMDGTITESSLLWDQAMFAAAPVYGVDWTGSELDAIRGRGMWAVADRFRILGADAEPQQIVAEIESRARALLSENPQGWLAGVREVLQEARSAGIRTALVTMTGRDVVEAILATLGADLFDVVISGDDVSMPKPDPDPYIRGIAALGISAAECIAIEDSLVGATSATRAGLTTIIVNARVRVEVAGPTVSWTTMSGRTLADLLAAHTAFATS